MSAPTTPTALLGLRRRQACPLQWLVAGPAWRPGPKAGSLGSLGGERTAQGSTVGYALMYLRTPRTLGRLGPERSSECAPVSGNAAARMEDSQRKDSRYALVYCTVYSEALQARDYAHTQLFYGRASDPLLKLKASVRLLSASTCNALTARRRAAASRRAGCASGRLLQCLHRCPCP